MKNSNDSIGSRIKFSREYRGLTITELSDKSDVALQSICSIEKGNKSVGLKTLVAIADVLKISLDYLVYGENCGYRYNPAAITAGDKELTASDETGLTVADKIDASSSTSEEVKGVVYETCETRASKALFLKRMSEVYDEFMGIKLTKPNPVK